MPLVLSLIIPISTSIPTFTSTSSIIWTTSIGSGNTDPQVDCTENQPLCSEYGVSGYPTLKVFRNGSPTDYAGPRKADGIISYMVK